MGPWQEFFASLVASLAWPSSIAIVAVLLRRPLIDLLANVKEVTYGGVKATFNKEIAEAVANTPRDRPPSGITSEIDPALLELAEVSPRAAIIESWLKLEALLRKAIDQKGKDASSIGGVQLINLAGAEGVITPETVTSLRGLQQLRNLAAHAPSSKLDVSQAREFLVLAEVNEYLVRQSAGLGSE